MQYRVEPRVNHSIQSLEKCIRDLVKRVRGGTVGERSDLYRSTRGVWGLGVLLDEGEDWAVERLMSSVEDTPEPDKHKALETVVWIRNAVIWLLPFQWKPGGDACDLRRGWRQLGQ